MLRSLALFIQSAIDIVLPRKERVVRTLDYHLDDIVLSPQEHDACGMRITTLMDYRNSVTEDLIQALKYDRAARAAELLALALAEYLQEEIANIRMYSTLPVMLVPVPLHVSRMRERGFNQVEKVLRELPEEFRNGTLSNVDTDLLIRTRATGQQTHLSRDARLRNVADAFARAHDAVNAHIILIDDVTTTGATLAAAAKPLNGAPSLTLLAFARA